MLECSILFKQDINVGTICVYVCMDGMALCFCWSAVPRLGKIAQHAYGFYGF